MEYSDINLQLGSLNLESYHQHQHQHQQYQHQQHHQQQYQHQYQHQTGTLGMEAVPIYSQQQQQQQYTVSSSSGADSPNTASSEIKSQNNQNAIVVPPEEAILKLCDRTKYQIIQENGQRRYGPPPDWKGTPPNRGCEVFIGKIPRDCFEDELVPIFEKAGRLYMFRLMMDFSGSNRGYGFCIYTNREDTKRAVLKLDNYEIRRGKTLGVCLSVDNCRLFVGGIPKTKAKHEILTEMKKVTEGVKDVIVYPSAADKGKNRGFAFVEYEHHKAAAMARRKLIPGRIQLWGHQIAVDWAEPEREVDEDIMSKVKILYVRNLMLNTTEEHLRDLFSAAAGAPDCVERVKKIRDYAFVHFRERSEAIAAMEELDDTEIDGSRVEVTLAKPVDKAESARAKTAAAAAAAGQQKLLQQQQQQPGQLGSLVISGQQAGLYHGLLGGGGTGGVHSMEPLALAAAYCHNNGGGGLMAAAQTLDTGATTSRPFRNAAGSRSAGARNAASSGYGQGRDKKVGHMELLDEICTRNGLGTPCYQVQTHELMDTSTGMKSNWFFGKVTIGSPGGPRQYAGHRFTQTTEEAKIAAAESALVQLTQPMMPMPMQMQMQMQMQQQQQQQQLPPTAVTSAGMFLGGGDPAAFLGEFTRLTTSQQQQQQQQQLLTQVPQPPPPPPPPQPQAMPLHLTTYAAAGYQGPLFAAYGPAGQQQHQQQQHQHHQGLIHQHQQQHQLAASNIAALPLGLPVGSESAGFPAAFLYTATANGGGGGSGSCGSSNGSNGSNGMVDPSAAYFAAATNAALNAGGGGGGMLPPPHQSHQQPPPPPPPGAELYAHYVN